MPTTTDIKTHGAPSGNGWPKMVIPWLFVIGGVVLIAYMIATNPKQKQLVCDPGATYTINSIGACHEE